MIVNDSEKKDLQEAMSDAGSRSLHGAFVGERVARALERIATALEAQSEVSRRIAANLDEQICLHREAMACDARRIEEARDHEAAQRALMERSMDAAARAEWELAASQKALVDKQVEAIDRLRPPKEPWQTEEEG